MASAEHRSLRLSRLESRRLLIALLVSLAVHLVAWGGYELDKKFGWSQRLHLPAWLHKPEKKNFATLVPAEAEPPMIFVDVSHAEPEPPKKARYYSNKNSQAANPDATADADQPKLDGKQKDIPKTEDTPKFSKLQPSPPKEQPDPAKTAEAAADNLGDLKLKKPEEQKTAQQPERPRTLKQAQQQLPGEKQQQDGGVRRQRNWASLDARSTPFGDYDRAIIEAVTQRWYDLLDSHRFAQDRTGKVRVYFKLKTDGAVEEVKILENTVGDLLGYVCSESVSEAAPFGKWPEVMRRAIKENYREITFTFYYY